MSTATADPTAPPARVWFAMLAAPAAWALQQWAIWFLDTHACSDARPWHFTQSSARWIEVGAHAVALALAVAALIAGVGAWRRSHDPGVAHVHAYSRPDYMAAIALFVAASFALAVFWALWPAFILTPCEPLR